MDFTPYNYVLNNQMKYIDPDGKQVDFRFWINAAVDYSVSLATKDSRGEIRQRNLNDHEGITREGPKTGAIESAEIQPADFIGGAIGFKFIEKNVSRFIIQESKGSMEEIGISLANKSKFTSEVAENLGGKLKNFIGEGAPITQSESGLLKVGKQSFGKQVRIGKDLGTHNFDHIDIARWTKSSTSKKHKNLQIKISAKNFYF
jgi:hypothetical protein